MATRFRLSFEFFPPKTDKGQTLLLETAAALERSRPVFYSVTYGAGGSTRDRTFEAVAGLDRRRPRSGAASLDGRRRQQRHQSAGRPLRRARHRSDGRAARRHSVRLRQSASRQLCDQSGKAAARTRGRPVRNRSGRLSRSASRCADRPIRTSSTSARKSRPARTARSRSTSTTPTRTSISSSARSVDVPIVPGIMPITNYANLVRFSDGCGAEIPRWIRSRLAAYQNDEASLKAFGTDVVTALCQRLVDGGAPGLHFYTLNQAAPTQAVLDRLSTVRWRQRAIGCTSTCSSRRTAR